MTQDTDPDIDPDIDSVVAELTLEEKARLVTGADFWHTSAVERLGVAPVMVSDGPHGLRRQPDDGDQAAIGGSLPATCFPTASALGSSWDRALLGDVGRAIAAEARDQGVSVVLGPGVNMKRSPLCGRNFEYLSEDPFLAGELALAEVVAVQEQGVGMSVKHFAANNQEHDRMRVSAEVDERTLREIYLPAFERVVTGAQPWTVMCAYNKLNGTYASEHHWLLTEVLREEWGFEGVVVSDWGAVHDRPAALEAGLDLEMPHAAASAAAVVEAVGSGRLATEVLDASVARVLRLVTRSGASGGAPAAPAYDVHHGLARRAAAESAVLLRNDGVLPLRLRRDQTLAVIGAFAAEPRYQGAGSSQVNPTRLDVPLEELRAALPAGVDVAYSPGFSVSEQPDARADTMLRTQAREIAREAEVVVMFLGLTDAAESEGFDRTHLDLPANQLALLETVVEVSNHVVVVLANGSVVRTSTWEDRVGAVLECWLGGQASGGAVADLLLGAANPSGKLAETIPLRLEDNPSYLNFPGDSQLVRYGEGVFVGYRAYDALPLEVSHPFGFGLSYTTFDLGRPEVTVTGSVASDDLQVEVRLEVTNTGRRAGAEVVQLYVADPESSVRRPERELKGFEKVGLEPGGSGRVTLTLDARAFSYWSVALSRWVVEAGEFVLHVGTSSRDLPHSWSLHLDAPSVTPPLSRDSTLADWLGDPHGHEVLLAVLESAPGGNPLADPGLAQVIGSMPLTTLAGFGFAGFDAAALDDLVARL